VSDPPLHERPFAAAASYLEPLERGAAAGPHDFSRLGPELSRRFRALKVWLALRAHGTDVFAEAVARNVAQARALAERLRAAPWAEVLAPVSLNVVCFRYVVPGRSQRELNHLNRRLLMQLQEQAIAVPSATMVQGAFAIRVAITNHRSREEDFQALVEGMERLGRVASNE
jgi:glutamate/tyrosine decarboxylase-like PLP-dependent enzyme